MENFRIDNWCIYGGTPNLAAIRTALNIDMSTYIAVHTSDMIMSAVYLLLVLSFGGKLIRPLLKDRSGVILKEKPVGTEKPEDVLTAGELIKKKNLLPILRNLGLSILIFMTGGAMTLVVSESFSTLIAILVITTLSLTVSLIPKVHNTRYTFQAGEYIIYVFCIAAGALGNIKELLKAAPIVILFVGFVLFGSFVLHILFCLFFKIDGDTMLITSTSAICSPPFVNVVAAALDCRDLILPGITTGLIGYAVGNYLGALAARLFSLL